MAHLTFDVEIAAPLDRVFVFFIPQRMPYWYGYDMDAHFEVQDDAAEFAVGQKVRIAGRLAGREASLTAVVTRYEWQRVLEWQFHDAFGVRGLQRWEVARAGEGARVTMVDAYNLPGRLSRFADMFLMRWSVARRDRRWLEQLRRLAEHR